MIGTAQLLGGQVVPTADHHRVFGAELGADDPDQPFMTEDPGFLAEPGAFPEGAGEFVGFTLLDGLKGWTGAGFGTVPAGESLQISRGSQSVTVADGPVSGYFFAIIDPDGGLHQHLTFELLGADGNPIPNDGVQPTAGIYLLTVQLHTSLQGVSPSEPFWIVLNNGDAEENHDLALDWAARHLAPEPANALAVGAALCLVCRPRGRK